MKFNKYRMEMEVIQIWDLILWVIVIGLLDKNDCRIYKGLRMADIK